MLPIPALVTGLVVVAVLILIVVFSETFGAEPNAAGNPIGGGTGYNRIITGTETSVKYVVSTKEDLLAALKGVKAGETVFVKGTAIIDLTGTAGLTIPAGVTLAGDRGLGGSAGGLLTRTKNLNGGWEEPMLGRAGIMSGLPACVSRAKCTPGLGNNEVCPGSIRERYYLVGIYAENRKGFEVDNCEIYGWASSEISLRENAK